MIIGFFAIPTAVFLISSPFPTAFSSFGAVIVRMITEKMLYSGTLPRIISGAIPLLDSPYMLCMKAIPKSAALLLKDPCKNSPRLEGVLTNIRDNIHINAMLAMVVRKQNETNRGFHVPIKSCSARSEKSSTGSATLKTNLFMKPAALSSIIPILLKK